MKPREPPEIAADGWGKGLYLPLEISDEKRVWSFVLLNYFYKSCSNVASWDSFGMLRMSRLQNCPWFWKLTKICSCNLAKQKTKLSFHLIFLKANIALYLSHLEQFLVVPEVPYISTSIMWENGGMSSMIWDIFEFCLHPNLLPKYFIHSINGRRTVAYIYPENGS